MSSSFFRLDSTQAPMWSTKLRMVQAESNRTSQLHPSTNCITRISCWNNGRVQSFSIRLSEKRNLCSWNGQSYGSGCSALCGELRLSRL
jgi:hypothetical protein